MVFGIVEMQFHGRLVKASLSMPWNELFGLILVGTTDHEGCL